MEVYFYNPSKKGDKKVSPNFRSITLQPVFEKVKLIFNT